MRLPRVLADGDVSVVAAEIHVARSSRTAEDTARFWAIEHLAGPHLDEVAAVNRARIAEVWDAVRERLESEIRYWDQPTVETRAQEGEGTKPRLNSGRARALASRWSAVPDGKPASPIWWREKRRPAGPIKTKEVVQA